MVLVISVLGPWGSGKTLTLTMLQELAKFHPEILGLPKKCMIASNYRSKFTDIYIYADEEVVTDIIQANIRAGIQKEDSRDRSMLTIHNPFTSSSMPCEYLLDFLKRPRDPNVHWLLCLDDVYGWLASYFFGNKFNRAVFRLFASGRKKNMNVVVSSIRFKDIDPRVRALHTHLFLPKWNDRSQTVTLDLYQVESFFDRWLRSVMFEGTRYYNAFDTYEIIESIYDREGSPHQAPQVVSSSPTQSQAQVLVQKGPSPPQGETSRKTPDGYKALAQGLFWQRQIMESLKQKGLQTTESYERHEHDVVVWDKGLPIEVIAIKTYTLLVSDKSGMANKKGQKVAVTFIARKDAQAEVQYAERHGLKKIRLLAMNLLTGNILHDGLLDFDDRITLREYPKGE